MNNPKSILLNQIKQLSGVENVSHLLISPESDDFMVVEIHLDTETVVDKLTPEEVQRRNYNANVRRGKITDKTTKLDFAYKALEEINELIESINNGDEENEKTERADIVHVIEAMSYHDGFDLQAEKERKMKINEQRTD